MTRESHQTAKRRRQSQLVLAPVPAPDMAPANRETTGRVDLSLPLVDCIAELLCVKRKRIYELARRPQNPVPSVRIGRAVRFVRAQVEEWVAGQTPS